MFARYQLRQIQLGLLLVLLLGVASQMAQILCLSHLIPALLPKSAVGPCITFLRELQVFASLALLGGAAMCLATPDLSARLLLTSLLLFKFLLDPTEPEPLVGALTLAFFILYLSRLARLLGHTELSRRAGWILVFGLAFPLLVLSIPTGLVGYARFVQGPILAEATCIPAYVLYLCFLARVYGAVREESAQPTTRGSSSSTRDAFRPETIAYSGLS